MRALGGGGGVRARGGVGGSVEVGGDAAVGGDAEVGGVVAEESSRRGGGGFGTDFGRGFAGIFGSANFVLTIKEK